ncbi:hypothetical protein EDD95_0316 [Streptomyces sp. CEV 2-1]|nr:hypothetical protein EDD95_0316 [Streptomyces sp. CEV 2-1]
MGVVQVGSVHCGQAGQQVRPEAATGIPPRCVHDATPTGTGTIAKRVRIGHGWDIYNLLS